VDFSYNNDEKLQLYNRIMNLVHRNGAQMHQLISLVIVLAFFLNLVYSQNLNNLNDVFSSKEKNELK